MLATQNLEFSYPGGEVMRFPDINCESGENCLLLGQSGSGKTTLLHLMGGLLQPDKGSIIIAGTDITGLNASRLDHFRGRNIGIIFQRAHFVRSLSVLDNLLLAQSLAGESTTRKKALDLLDSLGIGHKAYDSVRQLSVGEQQRVNIARAVINRPPVLLADEPTSALDDGNTHKVIELLETQAKAVNASLIIVTHDLRLTDSFPKQFELS